MWTTCSENRLFKSFCSFVFHCAIPNDCHHFFHTLFSYPSPPPPTPFQYPSQLGHLLWLLVGNYEPYYSIFPKPFKMKLMGFLCGTLAKPSLRADWRIRWPLLFIYLPTASNKKRWSCVNRRQICPPTRAHNCYLCFCLYNADLRMCLVKAFSRHCQIWHFHLALPYRG